MIRSEVERDESVRSRLREMLLRQKEKFGQYLDLLMQEGNSIGNGNVDQLHLQLDMESILIAEIRALRRVIDPLEKLYRASLDAGEASIPLVLAELVSMGAEMSRRNAANRAALQAKMEELKGTIAGLRVMPRTASGPMASPSLVDVTA
jgi:hypothetical protein